MVDYDRMLALGLDPEDAKRRYGTNTGLYATCMNIYFKTNAFAKLEQLCREKKWDEAFDCVHTMKGSAGNMSFMSLYNIYSEMTEDFRSGEPEKAVRLLEKARELENAFREAAGYKE